MASNDVSPDGVAILVATVWPDRHHPELYLPPNRPFRNLHLRHLYLYVFLGYGNHHRYRGPDGPPWSYRRHR